MTIRRSKWLIYGLGAVIVAAVGAAVAGYLWYDSQLKPYDISNQDKVRINIVEGTSAGQIGKTLEERKVIRSALAMSIYLRLDGSGGSFQKGVYSVSPSQSLPEVIAHLTSGKSDEKSITFYPGAMLERKSGSESGGLMDVVTVLKKAGRSEAEIEQALTAKYTSPVFSGRPEGQGLEGYVYGETYFVAADADSRQMIQRAIDELARVVRQNNFEEKFAKKGLTLYEGITLASIVQRESVGCAGKAICEDQRQIASVFYNRLEADMPLGSDVTYHYAADSQGLQRDFRLDSPYNTRIHAGLPPGPIASPGLSALHAVADPAETDYLYFLSGDDHITYFATTNAGHEANIRNHCHEKCLLP